MVAAAWEYLSGGNLSLHPKGTNTLVFPDVPFLFFSRLISEINLFRFCIKKASNLVGGWHHNCCQ